MDLNPEFDGQWIAFGDGLGHGIIVHDYNY